MNLETIKDAIMKLWAFTIILVVFVLPPIVLLVVIAHFIIKFW